MADKLTLARPYARAAFEYALTASALSDWGEALRLLSVAFDSPLFVRLIKNPQADYQQLLKVLVAVLGDKQPKDLENFLNLLIEYKRLDLLPEISRLFAALVAEREQIVDVQLSSAFSVSDEMAQKFVEALQTLLGRNVKLEREVDTSLLGGAIVRAGDKVIDDSVRTKLRRLHDAMVS